MASLLIAWPHLAHSNDLPNICIFKINIYILRNNLGNRTECWHWPYQFELTSHQIYRKVNERTNFWSSHGLQEAQLRLTSYWAFDLWNVPYLSDGVICLGNRTEWKPRDTTKTCILTKILWISYEKNIFKPWMGYGVTQQCKRNSVSEGF